MIDLPVLDRRNFALIAVLNVEFYYEIYYVSSSYVASLVNQCILLLCRCQMNHWLDYHRWSSDWTNRNFQIPVTIAGANCNLAVKQICINTIYARYQVSCNKFLILFMKYFECEIKFSYINLQLLKICYSFYELKSLFQQ